ncbi:hypothetical protein [Kineosporia sp. R_H_3]|uniref:hypothetical protein n=1 Tax=Kineosporia sp. R_H_3 TaxID=1961848 RepID=UPI00117A9348|nr:hypothetical protein [Kineosporia sp. R_H_3]
MSRKTVTVTNGGRVVVKTIGVQGPPGVSASFDDTIASPTSIGLTASTSGTANQASRRDHKHQLDTTEVDGRYTRRSQNSADVASPSTALSNLGGASASSLTSGLATKQPLDADLTTIAALPPSDDAVLQRKASAWTSRTADQLKGDLNLTKTDVGLPNVDNTSDASKPVSATQAAADAAVASAAAAGNLSAHTSRTGNPHATTKAQIGLANAENTVSAPRPANWAPSRPAWLTLNRMTVFSLRCQTALIKCHQQPDTGGSDRFDCHGDLRCLGLG